MFITILLLLIPFLTVAFLPWGLKSFSAIELDQMGVQLENSETPSDPAQPSNCIMPRMNVVCVNA